MVCKWLMMMHNTHSDIDYFIMWNWNLIYYMKLFNWRTFLEQNLKI